MKHELEIEQNVIGMGIDGSCVTCSDPDWTGNGWEGQVVFHGSTKSEVQGYFLDHVLDSEENR